tara:strand:+ start:754 stop:1065 length:312 start_codon:yes stop_codon:yes gene_type:complete
MVKAAQHAIKSGHGRYANMKCNHPVRDIHKNKQFRVKACENGHTKLVRFGDSHMKNRSYDPKHRASFRARHKCNQKKSKLTAEGPVKNGKILGFPISKKKESI